MKENNFNNNLKRKNSTEMHPIERINRSVAINRANSKRARALRELNNKLIHKKRKLDLREEWLDEHEEKLDKWEERLVVLEKDLNKRAKELENERKIFENRCTQPNKHSIDSEFNIARILNSKPNNNLENFGDFEEKSVITHTETEKMNSFVEFDDFNYNKNDYTDLLDILQPKPAKENPLTFLDDLIQNKENKENKEHWLG